MVNVVLFFSYDYLSSICPLVNRQFKYFIYFRLFVLLSFENSLYILLILFRYVHVCVCMCVYFNINNSLTDIITQKKESYLCYFIRFWVSFNHNYYTPPSIFNIKILITGYFESCVKTKDQHALHKNAYMYKILYSILGVHKIPDPKVAHGL